VNCACRYLGDSLASVMSGAPTVTSARAAAAANVGGSPYAIAIAAGSVTTSLGYLASFVSSGALTVNPAALTITASNQSKGYLHAAIVVEMDV
jgi:hypothetical protein